MGKAYRIPSAKDRLHKHQINIKDLEALNRLRNTPRPVAAPRSSGGSAGGATGGGTGNFLPTAGGTMVGNIAFDPRLIASDNGRVGLIPFDNNPKNSNYILVTGTGSSPFKIRFIDGAERNGQILYYQGTNQQIQNLLNANLLATTSIVGTGSTTIITVTLPSTGTLANGDVVNIVNTNNFNAVDVVISGLVANTSFTYDLEEIGSTTPEAGTIQDGNILTADGATLVLDGTVSILNVPIVTLIFDFTIIAGGGWRVLSVSSGVGGVTTTSYKLPVRAATIVTGVLATAYENGDIIDGVTLVTGNRILIKDQTTGSENGIYTVNATGAPTRATDFASGLTSVAGSLIPVEEGTVNDNLVFIITTNNPTTVGTTSLAFANISGSGTNLLPLNNTWTGLNTFEGGIQISDSASAVHGSLQGIAATGVRLSLTTGEKFQLFDNITNILEINSAFGINAKTLDIRNVDRLQLSGGTASVTAISDVVWYLNATGDLISNVNASDTWAWSAGNVTKMILTDSTLEKRNVTAPTFQLYNTRTAATGAAGIISIIANSTLTSTGVPMGLISADTENIASDGSGSLKLGVRVSGVSTNFITLNDSEDGNVKLLKNLDLSTFDINNVDQLEQEATGGVLTHTFARPETLADDTTIGDIRFRAFDGLGTINNYASIRGKMLSDVNAGEDGGIEFYVAEAGVHDVLYMEINGNNNLEFVQFHKKIQMSAELRMGGNNLVFDTDLDTSIDSLTDDNLRFITGGILRGAWTNTALIVENNFTVKGGIIQLGDSLVNDRLNITSRLIKKLTWELTANDVPLSGELAIGRDSLGNMKITVPTGEHIGLQVAASDKIRVNEDTIEFNNPLVFASTDAIGATEFGMGRNGTAIEINADATIVLQIDGADIAEFASSYVQFPEVASDPAAGTTSGKFYVKTVGGLAKPFFIGDGTAAVDLSGVGGSQTPWTSNIDGDGFSLQDFKALEFRDGQTAPASTIDYLIKDTVNIIYNAKGTDGHLFKIAGTQEFGIGVNINNSFNEFNLNSNKITNVTDPTANQDAATKKYVDDNDADSVVGMQDFRIWHSHKTTEFNFEVLHSNIKGNSALASVYPFIEDVSVFVPIFLGQRSRLKEISIEFSTGGTGTYSMEYGIYSAISNQNYPLTKVASNTGIFSGTGVKTMLFTTDLEAGMYFLAALVTTADSPVAVAPSFGEANICGFIDNESPDTISPLAGFSGTDVTLPTSPDDDMVGITTAVPPAIFAKFEINPN